MAILISRYKAIKLVCTELVGGKLILYQNMHLILTLPVTKSHFISRHFYLTCACDNLPKLDNYQILSYYLHMARC